MDYLKPSTQRLVTFTLLTLAILLLLALVAKADVASQLVIYDGDKTVENADLVIVEMRKEDDEQLITFLQMAYNDTLDIKYAIAVCGEYRKLEQYENAKIYAAQINDARQSYEMTMQIIDTLMVEPDQGPASALAYAEFIYEIIESQLDVEWFIYQQKVLVDPVVAKEFGLAATTNDYPSRVELFAAVFQTTHPTEELYMSLADKFAKAYPFRFVEMRMPGDVFIAALRGYDFSQAFADKCAYEFNRLDWGELGVEGGIEFCTKMLLHVPVQEETARLIMIIRDKRTILRELL